MLRTPSDLCFICFKGNVLLGSMHRADPEFSVATHAKDALQLDPDAAASVGQRLWQTLDQAPAVLRRMAGAASGLCWGGLFRSRLLFGVGGFDKKIRDLT